MGLEIETSQTTYELVVIWVVTILRFADTEILLMAFTVHFVGVSFAISDSERFLAFEIDVDRSIGSTVDRAFHCCLIRGLVRVTLSSKMAAHS